MATDKTYGVHPLLKERIERVLRAMADEGHPMRVCQGVRTAAYQAELYAQGRTKPGRRVTNCDGYKLKSNHQQKSDGWGYAVDCCFLGAEPFAEHHPWDLYGRKVLKEGLVWGGNWASKLVDRPHAELKLS